MAGWQMPRYKEVHLGQLRAFCECVRHGSFAAAARALNLSQPAVWQQVRALERNCRVSLLQRRGREFVVTEDGQVLWELAHGVLGSVESLWDAFERGRHEVARSLTVVASPGILTEELSVTIGDFCRTHPDIRLILLNRHGTGALDPLIQGDADLAVVPGDASLTDRQLFSVEMLCARLPALALPDGHPLLRRRKVGIADIVRHPLILPVASSPWRQQLDDLFRNAGLCDRMQVRVETGYNLAARRYVALGLGIALFSLPPNAIELPGVHIRPLGPPFPELPLFLLWRRGVIPRPQVRLFADFVRKWLAPTPPAGPPTESTAATPARPPLSKNHQGSPPLSDTKTEANNRHKNHARRLARKKQ